MDCESIEFDIGDDHVATITLDRPDQLNAIDDRMAAEIAWAWCTVRDDDDVHVAVIQANGDRAFCTGVDVKGEANWWRPPNIWNHFDPGETLSPKSRHRCWKPVIAAVHGMVAGGAQYFLNEADIIIAADDVQFFDPHANGGIVSALEPIGMRARGVPIGDVMRWALMGTEERITAQTALRIGLVTEVVPRDELRARAREIASSIASRSTAATQGTVRAVWESLDMPRSTALQNGMSYTHIGNARAEQEGRPARRNDPPTYR